jgi:hypothetical protein
LSNKKLDDNLPNAFVYFLEKEATEHLMLKDEFNTIGSTKLLWGLSKFANRSLAPGFNSEISGSIMNRSLFSKV